MQIILVSSHFYPSVGGVERQVEEIAYNLSNLGHNVQVFTTNAAHGKKDKISRLSETYKGFYIRRFKYWFKFSSYFTLAPGLIFKVLTSKYNVLHVHNLHDAHLIPLLIISIVRFKPLIITGHNPFVVKPTSRSWLANLLIKLHHFMVRVLRVGIKKYIALLPSESVSVQNTIGLAAKKIAVIPNGIQSDYYQQPENKLQLYQDLKIDITKWDLIVGTASRLNYVKGLQNLKYAVDQLPKVLFIFAGGDDGYATQLHNLYYHNTNVIFTNKYLPTNKMVELFAGIDVFLLPSNYEPFGMTLVEAMAQGTPIISTNVGGPPEILTSDFGDLLAPEDYQGWYNLISYYSKNKDLLASKSWSAKAQANKYTWENVINQLLTVYNN